jgi:Fe-S-cluster containining protein
MSTQDGQEEALRALYAEADGLFSGWSCPAEARCCQFGVTGREPQCWPIEWRLLARAVRARPGRRGGGEPGDCPAFDPSTRRCRTYDARPFGCRTHFCDLAEPAAKNPRAEIRALARRLADIAEKADAAARLLPLSTWAAKR